MRWSYGVTTVPERMHTLLPQTLDSLARAGFDKPWLFVDGPRAFFHHDDPIRDQYILRFPDLPLTIRQPGFNTVGNWILSAWELYLRRPDAHRYALFQDDFVTYRNLRQYLERCPFPKGDYWNLYTFPRNQRLCPEGHRGWYRSDQMGKGAVALVFDRDAIMTVLSSRHMVMKPAAAVKPDRSVDGAIVTGMKEAGRSEWVHNPSLVQHTGDQSSMGNAPHLKAESFLGDDYDALDLL